MSSHRKSTCSKLTMLTEEAIDAIRETLAEVRFGAISITIHDGKIVQFDITEKRRIPS